MRKPSLAVLALASLASGMTAASAADLPVRPVAPVVAPAPLWAGWYFGGNFGYGFGENVESTVTVVSTPFTFVSPPFQSMDRNGVLGGLQVGYNWQFGYSWVFGVVADIQATALKNSEAGVFAVSVLNQTVNANVGQTSKIDWFGTVRGKLGWAAGNWLFYGTGGLAYGEVDVAGFISVPGANGFLFSADSQTTRVGWTAGGGIDYAINNNLTVGVEYLFVDLGNETATATGVTNRGVPIAASVSLDQSFSTNIVRGTLNWRFSPY